MKALRAHAAALGAAARDPRVPWYARALAVAVVAYLFSPIDLIPDFVPVLGMLDDLVLVPLGILLVVRLIPPPVWEELLARAGDGSGERAPSRAAAGAILALWITAAVACAWLVLPWLRERGR